MLLKYPINAVTCAFNNKIVIARWDEVTQSCKQLSGNRVSYFSESDCTEI